MVWFTAASQHAFVCICLMCSCFAYLLVAVVYQTIQPWPNSCWIGSCFIIYLEEKILLYLAWSCILTSLFFDWLSNCFSVYLSEGERVNERGTCKKRPWPTFPRHCICFFLSKWSTGKVKCASKCQKCVFGGNQRRNCQSKIHNLISFHKWDSLIFWKRGQQQIHI